MSQNAHKIRSQYVFSISCLIENLKIWNQSSFIRFANFHNLQCGELYRITYIWWPTKRVSATLIFLGVIKNVRNYLLKIIQPIYSAETTTGSLNIGAFDLYKVTPKISLKPCRKSLNFTCAFGFANRCNQPQLDCFLLTPKGYYICTQVYFVAFSHISEEHISLSRRIQEPTMVWTVLKSWILDNIKVRTICGFFLNFLNHYGVRDGETWEERHARTLEWLL